ncbi:MAG: hypothetical protein Q4F60_03270 [Candidatus Saccharibacteria bacterium]|nr:hypothetical protein [Candidatus Saccharibacteria bacterium]
MVGELRFFKNERGYQSKDEVSKEAIKKIKSLKLVGVGALRAEEIDKFLAENA